MENNKQFIIGHRGFSSIYPENTELGFEMAAQGGFDGVELDVHLTKDKQLVVIHDENTIRTSPKNMEIQDSTLEELKDNDYARKFIGSTIENTFVDFKYTTAQTILTLKEFLDKFVPKFKVINIEVKTDLIHYENIEKMILDEIKPYISQTQFILSSFNLESIRILRELDSEVELGYLIYEKEEFINFTDEQFDDVNKFANYINILDTLYFDHKETLDKFKLPYITWQWRRGTEELNYEPKERDIYKRLSDDSDVYAQILDHNWR